MAATKEWYVNDAYRRWQATTLNVAGRTLALATKPGVFAHGSTDASSLLLAAHVRAAEGETVVHLNCRNGLLGAALASTAARVLLADRNVLAVEAARRTLALNGAEHVEVHVGHGAAAVAGVMADVVAIRIPQERVALLQLLHDALLMLKPGGRCYIAGATNEGAKTGGRTLEQLFGNAATVATESGHRIVIAVKRTNDIPHDTALESPYVDSTVFNEQRLTVAGSQSTFCSRPGVFSWDHLDEATAVLAQHIEVRPDDRVLDLGCGYGVLGVVAGRTAAAHPITMLDVDSEAVRSAMKSAVANGLGSARVMGSDVASAVLEEQFDLVVTNPPFHVGKATDLQRTHPVHCRRVRGARAGRTTESRGKQDAALRGRDQVPVQEHHHRARRPTFQGAVRHQGAVKIIKYLANLGYGSRREVSAMVEAGAVVRRDGSIIREGEAFAHDDVLVHGAPLDPPPGTVVMLHKPAGYVCSTSDAGRLVYELLPERFLKRSPVMASIGRLDRDTSGLLLFTDDGKINHRLASPRTHLPKVYEAQLANDLQGDEAETFASGTLMLAGESLPLSPATLEVLGPRSARVTVTEGRYHQVRRMFAAVGNHVNALHRSAIGGLTLGELPLGQWCALSGSELAALLGRA